MSAKLRLSRSWNPLRISPPPRGLLGRQVPHVLYANLQFEKGASKKDAEQLLDWIRTLGFRDWENERILKYLKQRQDQFRHCLEWLVNGSITRIEEPDEADRDEFWTVELSEKWELEPEVKFLQQHGLDHGRLTLAPFSQDGGLFGGIELEQTKASDPLDPICWYTLSLLTWDGSVHVSKCRYPKCGKFIYRPTLRRQFCDDNCRARFAADNKTPEEKRKYMRRYRSIPAVKMRKSQRKTRTPTSG